MHRLFIISLLLTSFLIPGKASAWTLYETEKDSLYLWAGTYTHYNDKDTYSGATWLVSLEVI